MCCLPFISRSLGSQNLRCIPPKFKLPLILAATTRSSSLAGSACMGWGKSFLDLVLISHHSGLFISLTLLTIDRVHVCYSHALMYVYMISHYNRIMHAWWLHHSCPLCWCTPPQAGICTHEQDRLPPGPALTLACGPTYAKGDCWRDPLTERNEWVVYVRYQSRVFETRTMTTRAGVCVSIYIFTQESCVKMHKVGIMHSCVITSTERTVRFR